MLIRRFLQNRKWIAINTIGLSIAFAVTIIVYSFVRQELSYDCFHSKSEDIYRITLESNTGLTSWHPARVSGNWTMQLPEDYPEIVDIARLFPFRKAIITIGNKKFYSHKAYQTDSSFFKVFDFDLLSGSKETVFAYPHQAAITKSLALKYFGSVDVIGKEIEVLHQRESQSKAYTIKAVMEDFPANSHFHADLLCSIEDPKKQNEWAYTYLLLEPGASGKNLQTNIQSKWDRNAREGTTTPTIHIQALRDIHLYSHKTREMEQNGNITTVFLLLGGALIVLLIAILNYSNLNYVQFLTELKNLKIRMINGASRFDLSQRTIAEAFTQALIAIVIGTILVWDFEFLTGFSFPVQLKTFDVLILASAFLLLIGTIAIVPLFTKKLSKTLSATPARGAKKFVVSLVFQFMLSIVAITSTLVLQKQIDFINNHHPGAQDSCYVIMPKNTWEAVQQYETFKEKILSHPSILEVSSALEEPGGDILDNFRFEMEGVDDTDKPTINIFTCDSNFFSFFNIEALAGTVNFGETPSIQWENNAMYLNSLRRQKATDSKKYKELEAKVTGYREKYLLNRSALKLLGIPNPKDAIGKRFRLNFNQPELFPEGEIIGVVDDFHYTNLFREEKPLAIVSKKMFNSNFLVRIDKKQKSEALAAIKKEWDKINPNYPFQYEFITDSYQKVYANEYNEMKALSLFAVLSVILSALGMYALASYSIQHKIKEIGIRKANGGSIGDILLMLNGEFLKWVGIAFVIACPIAWSLMNNWLNNFAYRTPIGWELFLFSGAIATGIAILTVSWQTWKAANQDPVEALKYE
ncbi:MAG: ABC transporter permease [Marinifilaceae bacterium]